MMMVLMTFSIPVYAGAESTTSITTNDGGPTALFNEMCDNFFGNSEKYNAISKQGQDVSKDFYAKYIAQYNACNYDALWIAFQDELSAFNWKNETVERQLSRSLLELTASESFYRLGKTVNNMPGKAFEILFTISGDYTVNDGTSEIIYASSPSLDISYSGEGALFSVETQGISTNTKINAAKDTVTFSASFYSDISMEDPYVGITLWTERTGPYKDSTQGNS